MIWYHFKASIKLEAWWHDPGFPDTTTYAAKKPKYILGGMVDDSTS